MKANWVPIGCQLVANRTPIGIRSCPNWCTIWYRQWAKWQFQSSITRLTDDDDDDDNDYFDQVPYGLSSLGIMREHRWGSQSNNGVVIIEVQR